jgi:pimeloyl-[acyl-carrier protein] methyl ester esterase
VAEKLKIITSGQGPDLVLLHGWAMHSGIWGGLASSLSSEYRVNLVDLPGHGVNRHIPLSRDLHAVAKQILSRVPPAVWIGWSLGGLVTLAAAMQQPQKVNKVIMVAATPSFSMQPHWECGVDATSRRTFSAGLDENPSDTLAQFWLQCFGAEWTKESLRLMGKTSVNDDLPAKEDLQAGLHLLYDNDLTAELKTCRVPTLLIGGTRDRTIRAESFSRAADLLPLGEAILLRTSGHAPFITHRDRFLAIIRGFLNGERAA